jgi:hypothetical protein
VGRAVVGAGGPARALAGTVRAVGQVEVGDGGVALEAAMAAGVAEGMDPAAAVAVAVKTRGLLARASASSPS